MRFQDLGLLPELVSNAGYDAPTPVQSESIPAILNGRDVLAGAQTGTGKTAAFILPVMQKLYAGESKRSPRGLVLAPTRELAAQVADSARRYGKGLGLKQTSIFGGVSYGGQLKALRSGLDLVIATPGRLIDHLNQGSIDLSNVQTLILDEADRMLDMGFVRDIERIISKCHGKRQTLLFSATYNKGIKRLASKYLDNPIEVAVARENTVSESVEQTFVHVDQHRKRELLTQLIGLNDMHQVLVFTKTKFGADKLARALTGDGLPAVAMHGNKSQAQRTKALQKFKRGAARILVATDVAARGLDIQKLPYVINFELPMVAEDYVHRIGRTGRAGEKGDAISFVCATEHRLMRDIQHLLKIEVEFEVADGFEPTTPFPVKSRNTNPSPESMGNRTLATTECAAKMIVQNIATINRQLVTVTGITPKDQNLEVLIREDRPIHKIAARSVKANVLKKNSGQMIPCHQKTRGGRKPTKTVMATGQVSHDRAPKDRILGTLGTGFPLPNAKQ